MSESIILGIETSCDETAAAVFHSEKGIVLSSCLFSQIKLHEVFGGVVPEIASRSHLEKINELYLEGNEISNLSGIGGPKTVTYLYVNENRLTDPVQGGAKDTVIGDQVVLKFFLSR